MGVVCWARLPASIKSMKNTSETILLDIFIPQETGNFIFFARRLDRIESAEDKV